MQRIGEFILSLALALSGEDSQLLHSTEALNSPELHSRNLFSQKFISEI